VAEKIPVIIDDDYEFLTDAPGHIETLVKIEGKEANFLSKIYEGHIWILCRSKKEFIIILCLCTFK